jgi:hypothetical protein
MGWRNFLLLIVGLVGFSLYITYILTGWDQGRKFRIPIDEGGSNFMVKM